MDIRFYDLTNERKKRIEVDADFESQMSAPSAILAYQLTGIKKNESINQINIFCSANATHFDLEKQVVDGFWDIVVPYDANSLLSITEVKDKKQEIKKLFKNIFYPIFSYKNWDLKFLEETLEKIEKVDFKNEFLLKGTPKKSPDRKYLAVVKCIEDITSFQMHCSIYDNRGILCAEKILVQSSPSPFVYRRFIGEPVWNNNAEFCVKSKTSQWSEIVIL